ncbi:sialyltransferase [Dorcoceras hygrometricum]|uniref:Sialyltransferase n=1 Tax=Dorcoceras hygrometricum TaxID=472368 RepID=A0A2Z7B305_9LAMI|nr:sialyltransferase [Dorcoceras hygrometricum]
MGNSTRKNPSKRRTSSKCHEFNNRFPLAKKNYESTGPWLYVPAVDLQPRFPHNPATLLPEPLHRRHVGRQQLCPFPGFCFFGICNYAQPLPPFPFPFPPLPPLPPRPFPPKPFPPPKSCPPGAGDEACI